MISQKLSELPRYDKPSGISLVITAVTSRLADVMILKPGNIYIAKERHEKLRRIIVFYMISVVYSNHYK